MLVGGLRQSTLFKLSVFGSCGFLTFCPTGRHRGLGEHMFNSTCPLFHPLPLVNHLFSLHPSLSPFPLHSSVLSFICFFHFPFALPNFHVHLSTRCSPHHPGLLERAAKEPEGAQNVARPAGERRNTGSGD